ncbi:hypothetical protein PHISCL_11083, partial [Aspergillus sclerotialis]
MPFRDIERHSGSLPPITPLQQGRRHAPSHHKARAAPSDRSASSAQSLAMPGNWPLHESSQQRECDKLGPDREGTECRPGY